jgi:hypothetical protein
MKPTKAWAIVERSDGQICDSGYDGEMAMFWKPENTASEVNDHQTVEPVLIVPESGVREQYAVLDANNALIAFRDSRDECRSITDWADGLHIARVAIIELEDGNGTD